MLFKKYCLGEIMAVKPFRDFGKIEEVLDVPNLTRIQTSSYSRFLQTDVTPDKREKVGLEALLHEIFPIVSYNEEISLEYLDYELGMPRYTSDDCRELRLTYGLPFRVRVRLTRKSNDEIMEDSLFLGELPIMIGGGEFIINGAERVIVNQLHRSPGVDFVVDSLEGDRPLHAARIIPERGSWIEINVTKKDIMVVRIDQSSKISAMTFLRAMDDRFTDTEDIIREFYETKSLKVANLTEEMWTVGEIIDKESGEVLLSPGCQIGENLQQIQQSALKKLEVIEKVLDPLILNSLADDGCANREEALLKIYARLRPGNPAKAEKAEQLFKEKFYDCNRYRLGRVGRFRVNRKYDQDIPETEMTLRPEDFLSSLQYIVGLRNGEGHVDDIDHLGNRRIKTISELAGDEIRKGFLKLRRSVQERMSLKDMNEVKRIAELINSKSVTSSVDFFFGRGELSQVVDQTNPLSQLAHERRLSALGPGGLNRKRAGFEVRDVHISHYGRICPIETPEGTNIGLISSLAIYSDVDQYGFLVTPYRKVIKNGLDKKLYLLRADEEMEAILSPVDCLGDEGVRVVQGYSLVRVNGDLASTDSSDIDYVDVSSKQTVGVSAALIPFLEHDDANRALMGSNMQRQAVPLIITDAPIVSTGMEREVANSSSMLVRARVSGTVTYVDASKIIINHADVYKLRKFVGLNERTCQNQKPIIVLGEEIKEGQVLADGAATELGQLALGKNLLVGFMMFEGYNFEDAILVNQNLVKHDAYTSIHINCYDVEIRETKLGREEFTRDIPNVSEKALAYLDEDGVIQVGTKIRVGDILVGKVSPKSKSELSPEEKLLYAIFGRAGEDVKNESLELPSGEGGVVIKTKRFSRRMYMDEEQRKEQMRELKDYQALKTFEIANVFRQLAQILNEALDSQLVDPSTKQKLGVSANDEVIIEQIDTFDVNWITPAVKRNEMEPTITLFIARIHDLKQEMERRIVQLKRGDELPSGVLEMVKVWVATKRTLKVGDKMAGRHGNKGVIARVLPVEDMPYLADGTPLDICLNPLGIPGRMNVGQVLETHLGWAADILGFQAVTPVFGGCNEAEVHACVKEANEHVQALAKGHKDRKEAPSPTQIYESMPYGGKITVYDGRSGEPFEQEVNVGRMYMMKLHHLVDDKIHARATGPYSLITQQPLGGKARTGGQRFGEMEVWGLEAYGAAYILQELLTVKSDDVEGRTKIYESMVKGTNTLDAGTPVSFDVLCNEIRGLGLNIQLEKKRVC
jgi:DNA-directed RNA polymerase subunit beta